MKRKLCLGIMKSDFIDPVEQIHIFKRNGFDAFFSEYGFGEIKKYREIADELGMVYQSVHAPYTKMRHMWYQSEETDIARQELIVCVTEAAEYNVPIVVVHPFIGFDINNANEFGVQNFKIIVDYAKDKGVKIAFENVEGESYLEALMSEFKTYDNVGFCWDSGHEMCYNQFKDMLALYGDRLIATHINDNIGMTGEEIFWTDDLHLVPFDGVKDWQDAMDRLDQCGYDDIMTFELKIDVDIDKKCGTDYYKMDFEDYVKYVYNRAQKLVNMRRGDM